MIKLFYTPGACSRASHIALQETGAEFQPVRVDLLGGEQRKPEYLAINPKGRVPALATDDGVLTENAAILAWIVRAYPAARLAPADSWGYAQALSFNGYLSSTVHVAHSHGRRGYRWADEESSFADMRRKVPQTMTECFRLIEDEMFKGPWVLGQDYSICDPYLFTIAGWLEIDDVDPAQFPKVHEHRQRMAVRPAVQAVLAREAA